MNTIVAVEVAFVIVATLVVFGVITSRSLRDRPRTRTSARDRLTRLNPALARNDSLRWSVASRRVRVDRLTTLVVCVALRLTTLQPLTVASADRDR